MGKITQQTFDAMLIYHTNFIPQLAKARSPVRMGSDSVRACAMRRRSKGSLWWWGSAERECPP
jgi:hypothetical protein